jgi:methionyl aminopeptidase
MSITYKDNDGIQGMRTAGRLAAEVLDYLTPTSSPASPRARSTGWRPSA